MFCPRCAADNVEGAQFCRSCGANISLVPQALTGELVERPAGGGIFDPKRMPRDRARRSEEVSIERAVRSFFMGVAFILVAFSVRFWAPAGHIWWFWMFLPAAGLLADGVSTYLRLRERRARFAMPPYAPGQPSFAPAAPTGQLPERTEGEMVRPPSVTEGTTRHLAANPPRRREEA
jgi:hypothetical protein